MNKVMDIFDKMDSMFAFIAKIAVLILMVLTTADALMRYIFNHAITGAFYFSENYLMVIIVFLSMSYAMKMGGHIRIDIFLKYFPQKLLKVLDVIYPLLTAALMFTIGYLGMNVTIEYFVNKNVEAGLIAWPLWLSWVWIPIGAFMFTLRLLLISIQHVIVFNKEVIKEEFDQEFINVEFKEEVISDIKS